MKKLFWAAGVLAVSLFALGAPVSAQTPADITATIVASPSTAAVGQTIVVTASFRVAPGERRGDRQHQLHGCRSGCLDAASRVLHERPLLMRREHGCGHLLVVGADTELPADTGDVCAGARVADLRTVTFSRTLELRTARDAAVQGRLPP